jgi:hypothetical protein
MKKIELKWQKKYLSDNSGSWLETTVPVLKWVYSVEQQDKDWLTFLIMPGVEAEYMRLTKKKYARCDAAQTACEKHLTKTYKAFKNLIKKNGNK